MVDFHKDVCLLYYNVRVEVQRKGWGKGRSYIVERYSIYINVLYYCCWSFYLRPPTLTGYSLLSALLSVEILLTVSFVTLIFKKTMLSFFAVSLKNFDSAKVDTEN